MTSLQRPVTFGLFDGIVCYLGVMLGLLGHPGLIIVAAIGIGAAEMVGMAAGEWLSESRNGFVPSLAIGVATGAGAVIPAIPYGLGFPAWYARGWSVGLILAITAVIAWQRRGERSLPLAAAESYGVLLAAAVVVAVCVHFTPGGTA